MVVMVFLLVIVIFYNLDKICKFGIYYVIMGDNVVCLS